MPNTLAVNSAGMLAPSAKALLASRNSDASAAMPRIESIQIVRSIIKPLRRKVCRRVRVKPHRKFVKCFINN
jgi:hypothetical protein